MTTFMPEADAPMPEWWHPLPSDLPRRQLIPSLPDPALRLSPELADEADMVRISHYVLGGGR